MGIDESALAAHLRKRHGVTTAARLDRLGITTRSTRTLVGRGRLRRIARGVFVCTSWPDALEHRLAVACAVTGGVVCYPTAGIVWELRKTPRSPDVHVWVHEGRRVDDRPGVRIHYSSDLPATDVVSRSDGIAVTSPPRTAFDASGVLSHDDLESLIEQGIDRDYFMIPTLWDAARRLCRPGRRGSRRFTEVLRRREPWRRAVDSDYELRLERAMRHRGFPPLTRQHRLVLPDGEVIHPDLGLPDHGFFVEVDHRSWHGGRLEGAYDSARDLRVRAAGYHVERVSEVAIDRELGPTIEHLWTVWQRIRLS